MQVPHPKVQAFLVQDRFFEGQYDEMIDAMRTVVEKGTGKKMMVYIGLI